MSEPFQFWVFLISFILCSLFTWVGLVSLSIRSCLKLLEKEATNGSDLDEAFKAELKDLTIRETIGKVMGTIESAVYIYALVVNHTEILGGVLAFKAFTGWLSLQSGVHANGRNMPTLVRFYSYAIGNFLSLLWAIFSYELVRAVIQANPCIAQILVFTTNAG